MGVDRYGVKGGGVGRWRGVATSDRDGYGWANVTPKYKDGSETPLRRKWLGKSQHLLSGPDRASAGCL